MAGIKIDELTCENCASGREKPKLSNWNYVPILYPVPSGARPSYSRTSSSVSIRPRRHYWRLLIMLLALFQVTEAYITGNINFFFFFCSNYLYSDWASVILPIVSKTVKQEGGISILIFFKNCI